MVNIKILIMNMILMVSIEMVFINDTNDKYNPNGFDINRKHKDTGTFLDKKNDIRKDISKNWLKDKDEFLKLYDEIIKNGGFSKKTEKNLFHQSYLKIF